MVNFKNYTMNIKKIIEDKITISKYLFECFNKAFKVSNIREYCLREDIRKGEIQDIDGNNKILFNIHGLNIDFTYKGKMIICYYIDYRCFSAYSLFVFHKNVIKADFNILEKIQDYIENGIKAGTITKVNDRDWYYFFN